jgi:hypothetical protein
MYRARATPRQAVERISTGHPHTEQCSPAAIAHGKTRSFHTLGDVADSERERDIPSATTVVACAAIVRARSPGRTVTAERTFRYRADRVPELATVCARGHPILWQDR